MKLPIAARDLLRKRLREHADIEGHVQGPEDVEQMRKQELLALAKKLRINVRGVIEEAKRDHPGLEAILHEEELARFRYTNANPAFSGILEFDLDLGMLGKKVSRKARMIWECTPDWKYFDLKQQRIIKGWPHDTMHMEVLAVLEGEFWKPGPDGNLRECESPVWTKVDLLDDGVLTNEVMKEIDDRIDEMCRQEDAARRARLKRSPRRSSQRNSAKADRS
jgi:hypothetical protein